MQFPSYLIHCWASTTVGTVPTVVLAGPAYLETWMTVGTVLRNYCELCIIWRTCHVLFVQSVMGLETSLRYPLSTWWREPQLKRSLRSILVVIHYLKDRSRFSGDNLLTKFFLKINYLVGSIFLNLREVIRTNDLWNMSPSQKTFKTTAGCQEEEAQETPKNNRLLYRVQTLLFVFWNELAFFSPPPCLTFVENVVLLVIFRHLCQLSWI